MTEDELKEIEARAAAAPWPPVWNEVKALVHEDVPALCAALREAWAQLAQVRPWLDAMNRNWVWDADLPDLQVGDTFPATLTYRGQLEPLPDDVEEEQPQAQAQEGGQHE